MRYNIMDTGTSPVLSESNPTGEVGASVSEPPEGEPGPNSGPERNPATDGRAPYMQNLFVMRHGERMDDANELWARTAPRPWDPPLTEKGKCQAWIVGKRLRNEGWDITRVLVSPFLRCVETAAEVITALCLVDSSSDARNSREAIIDPSKVKVSFEFGLAELMNARAIQNPPEEAIRGAEVIPWHLELAELATKFPAGTFDSSLESILPSIPAWRESMAHAQQRFADTFSAMSSRHVKENILCITHGQGVGVAVSEFQYLVYAVDYCAHAHVQRPIYSSSPDGSSFNAGEWELLTESGPSGVLFGKFNDEM